MGTTVKGFLKGLRYITQIFDEEKEQGMQIGFPTDVKHVAHIGSDGPAANAPSWMSDFKPQEGENGQVVSRGDVNNKEVGEGVGLQELLPPPEKPEKLKHKKTRRKSESLSQHGSPPRRSSAASASDLQPKHSSRRHHRSRHGSIDSSNDPSVRRSRRAVSGVTDTDGSYPLSDGSSRKSRHRKLKGSGGGAGEMSMKKTTKAKPENSSVHSVEIKTNDNNNIGDKD